MFGGKRKWRSTMVVNRNDIGTHWRGTILENGKGLWYPLLGHGGGEQKGTVVHTGGAPWWRTEKSRPDPENKPSPSSLQVPLLTEVSD
jgi:hypothetical protein